MAQQQLHTQLAQNQKQRNHVIFEDQDFDKLQAAQRKLYMAPIKTMSAFTIICAIFKYGNLSRLLPNPLAQPNEQSKLGAFLKSKNKLIFLHSLAFIGIASFLGAFFAKQIHTFQLFAKYRKQTNYFLRWKIEEEVKKQVRN